MSALFYWTFIFLLFVIGYPVAAILFYPLYKLLGGMLPFKEYMRDL